MSWVALRYEIEQLFFQHHPLDIAAPVQTGWMGDGWLFFNPDEREELHAVSPQVRAQRRREANMCTRCRQPRAEGSKNFCAYHVMMNRPSARKKLRAAAARVQEPVQLVLALDQIPTNMRDE